MELQTLRLKPEREKSGFIATRFVMPVGVVTMVRSADGPASVFFADGSKAQTHAIASSIHFEPLTGPVEWYMIIREKMLPDFDDLDLRRCPHGI